MTTALFLFLASALDISYLRHIPNMVIMSPKDGAEMRSMFRLALEHNGPVAIRYPRGNISLSDKPDSLSATFGIGEAEVLREGTDVAIIGIGNTVYPALRAARKLEREGVSSMVVNARFVKPLDHTLFTSIASEIPRIITVEENVLQGGFGSALLELFNKVELSGVRVKRLGIPDVYVEQGSQKELRQLYGLDEEGIHSAVLAILKEPTYSF